MLRDGLMMNDAVVIRIEAERLDHVELMEFIKDHPEKLLAYMDEHIADDEMQDFAHDFFAFAMYDTWGGTTIQEWRGS